MKRIDDGTGQESYCNYIGPGARQIAQRCFFIGVLVFCAALVPMTASSQPSQTDLEERFETLNRFWLETLQDRVMQGRSADEVMLEKYHELGFQEIFSASAGLSNDELTLLFRSAALVSFELPQAGLAPHIAEVFAAIEARDALETPHIQVMYRTWVREGKLERAEAHRRQFPGYELTPLPLMQRPESSDTDYSIWKIDPDDHALLPYELDYGTGLFILVGAAPNCAFVDRAASDLFANGQTAIFFGSRSAWLATNPESLLQVEAIGRWNEQFAPKMLIVENPMGWPLLKYRSTPTFYILQDGELIETLRGWEEPTQQRIREIAQSF
ncbi:MAG: hypothetical protein ACXIUL_06975 [Wenzhouxiangella sp.]